MGSQPKWWGIIQCNSCFLCISLSLSLSLSLSHVIYFSNKSKDIKIHTVWNRHPFHQEVQRLLSKIIKSLLLTGWCLALCWSHVSFRCGWATLLQRLWWSLLPRLSWYNWLKPRIKKLLSIRKVWSSIRRRCFWMVLVTFIFTGVWYSQQSFLLKSHLYHSVAFCFRKRYRSKCDCTLSRGEQRGWHSPEWLDET